MFLDLSFNQQAAAVIQAEATGTTEIVLPRFAGDTGETVISVVTSDVQRERASALINRRYAWRGYGSHHRLTARSTQTSFTVTTNGRIAGTLTLTVDSDAGLATDVTFREELNTFRRVPGASICELTRFAFDAEAPSKRILAALFHVIFIYGRARYGCTDLFIEVAQRHRRYYEAMLGFERVCPLKTNDSVGVPSQLMRLEVASIRTHIDAHAGQQDNASCRSLYPFFFSGKEEERIRRQIVPVADDERPALAPKHDACPSLQGVPAVRQAAPHDNLPAPRSGQA